MTVWREGLYSGGLFVIPRWRAAVDLSTRDLIVFDAEEAHGNTEIVATSGGCGRLSAVMYFHSSNRPGEGAGGGDGGAADGERHERR